MHYNRAVTMLNNLFLALRRRTRKRRYLQIERLTRLSARSGLLLDLGGSAASFFASFFPNPSQIILLDISQAQALCAKEMQPAFHVVVADGERLPFADGSIEMTVCNSVIEHVHNPGALASEIRRVSRDYFLQMPNRDFPLELHSFVPIPFYHRIPFLSLKRLVCRAFGGDFDYINGVHYLSEQHLRELFPEARMVFEPALGLTKSFYVYRMSQPLT